MGTELIRGWRLERSSLLTRETAILFLAAAAAWLVVLYQAQGMSAMGAVMGVGPAAFILLWVLMMAAMMLPSLAPVATPYARTAGGSPLAVLAAVAIGYLAVWAVIGALAFAIASFAASFAMDRPGAGRIMAIGAFVILALYQLSPIRRACLLLCRSTFERAPRATGNPLAGLAAGARYGLVCVGSSWALMLVMVPVGFMNIALMLVLAAVVFVERFWSRGLALARVVGVIALLLAAASIWAPQLSHNLS